MQKITPQEQIPEELLSFRKKVTNSFWKGQKIGAEGAHWSIPLIAMETATAKRGEVIPTFAAKTIGWSVTPVVSGVISAGLTLTLGIPPPAAAVVSSILTGIATSSIENSMIRKFTTLSKQGDLMSRVNFGSGYIDTQSAQQRRRQASIELAGAMPTSRRWLGQEAAYLHN
jgi:hypothetical protein